MKKIELTGTLSAVLAVALMSTMSVPAFAEGIQEAINDYLPGGDYNAVTAMSGNGEVVVGYGSSQIDPKAIPGTEAFSWTEIGEISDMELKDITGLGDLPGGPSGEPDLPTVPGMPEIPGLPASTRTTLSRANGVSADGSLIVGSGTTFYREPGVPQTEPEAHVTMMQAVVWSDGEIVPLTEIPDAIGGDYDMFNSSAAGVSADGSFIVGVAQRVHSIDGHKTDWEAVIWSDREFNETNETATGLGYLSGEEGISSATAISADGTVVVGSSSSELGMEAFRWTEEEGMVGLGFLGNDSFDSSAMAASADGSVIVGVSNDEAFRWTEENGMVALGWAGSNASAVSADGSIIVGTRVVGTDKEAYLWTAANGMRALKDILIADFGFPMTNWELSGVTGMSADGMTIVGYGFNPVGKAKNWIVTLPEPTTVMLLAFGSFAVLKRKG